MFENIQWDQLFMVLGVGSIGVAMALKVMFDAKRQVEELERENL